MIQDSLCLIIWSSPLNIVFHAATALHPSVSSPHNLTAHYPQGMADRGWWWLEALMAIACLQNGRWLAHVPPGTLPSTMSTSYLYTIACETDKANNQFWLTSLLHMQHILHHMFTGCASCAVQKFMVRFTRWMSFYCSLLNVLMKTCEWMHEVIISSLASASYAW